MPNSNPNPTLGLMYLRVVWQVLHGLVHSCIFIFKLQHLSKVGVSADHLLLVCLVIQNAARAALPDTRLASLLDEIK